MTHCPRCGKTGLQPDSIHTCTPRALVLADALDNPTIQAVPYGTKSPPNCADCTLQTPNYLAP